jgi:GDP-4-dehydro-6-deoxy-D-mannose reductase
MRPVGAYGRSKVLQERVALQFRQMTGLHVVCVRPFNHIGPGQSERFVVASLARQIARAEAGLVSGTIQLGRTDTARDFTDVRDVVRAYLGCLRDGEAGAVYNIGSGRSYSIAEIAERLAATATVPVSLTSVAARARPGDVLRTQCDASRVSQCTGWAPQISMEHTLRDTLDYWRGQINGPHRPGSMESAAGDPR